MAQQNGRKKTTSGGKAGVHKRGSGLGSGGRPAGSSGGYSGRKPAGYGKPSQGGSKPSQGYSKPSQSGSSTQWGGSSQRGDGSGRGILSSLLGLGGSSGQGQQPSSGGSGLGGLSGIISLFKSNKTFRIIAIVLVVLLLFWIFSGGSCGGCGACSLGQLGAIDPSALGVAGSAGQESEPDLSVSNVARDRYTAVRGDGSDKVTVMVYMCGTDLESKYGMATSDLKEMIGADLSENVRIVVETGGTQKWNNQNVSNTTNQIFEVTDAGLVHVKDVGKKSMVDPATLSEFIKFCKDNYSADRYMLIFWDHGGGSVTGYGYDQLYPKGSMTLDKIDKALKEGGCKFDFIGFDACLMATLETALVTERYADYLIASEETEPGVGWYYTDWLTTLSKNTSMGTVELGKEIIDSFVETCASKAPRDKTTLSIIDLAELSATVPESFRSFALSTGDLIENNDYKKISDARAGAREFASGINQVDLIDLARKIGTAESKAFAGVLDGCVKYNRTSTNIANAHGISIYFPCGSNSSLSGALSTYDKIGLDDSYGDCIKSFASVSAGGQIAGASGGAGGFDLLGSLFGGGQQPSGEGGSLLSMINLLGGSSGGGSSTPDLIGTALSLFLGNRQSEKLTHIDVGQDEDWFDADRVLDSGDYIAENYLDPSLLVATEDEDGRRVLRLSEEEWNLVQTIELNVFFDDGEGYIDLGLDNVFERADNGDLYLEYDSTWLCLDGHPVAYYMISEDYSDDGSCWVITGYIPAFIDGERMDIIVEFSNEHEEGIIVGARPVYTSEETATVAKGLAALEPGMVVEPICDYYSYAQEFKDNYLLGDSFTVGEQLKLRNIELETGENERLLFGYCLTDIYGNRLWTPMVPVVNAD